MPPAIPLVAAVAGAAATSAIGAGILGSIAGALVAGVVNLAGSRIFAKQPKAPAFSADAQGRTSVVRSSVESHKVIYGQAKVSGPLVYVGTTNDGPNPAEGPKENKFLHYIIPVAGHEVEEIGTVYLNDLALTLDANGYVTNAPFYKTTSTDVAITATISTISRLAGTVTVTTGSPHGFLDGETVTINAQSASPNFDGVFTIASTPTPTTFTYASGGNGGSSALGGSASVVRTTTTSSSYVVVRKQLGTADQAADSFALANILGWTVDHRLRGIAYLYIRMEWNPDLFPSGPPNIAVVVKGKKVYDPRTDTVAWSDNAALCIRDYLANDYGFNCDAGEINDAHFIAGANVCDESVTLKTGGAQSRYTCNGVIDTAVAPLDNLNALVSSLAGAVTYVQGAFRLHAGAYDAPAGDITTAMFAGGMSARARPSRKDLFNAVKGTYVDPDRNWQPTDFPPVTSSVYEAQDGGERIFKDLELPFTNHPEAAQRIAKLVREKARQGIVVEVPLMLSAWKFAVFDTVRLTDDQLGWTDKVFRILKYSTTGIGVINVVLQEESSASYDWDGTTEASTIDAAPDTNLPNPLLVAPPGTPLVTESLYATTDGSGVKAKATLTWPASPDAFLREYQAEFKPISAADYVKLPRTTATIQEILDIAPGTYNFQVKAVNNLGVSSAFAPTTQVMYGLTDAPAQVRNFSLNAIAGAAHLSWNQATDLDVLIGGSVRIRHSTLTAGANWNSAIDIGQALPGISTQAVLPLLDGTYLAKFIDSVGNPSVNPATLSATLVSLIEMNVVETLAEDPDFAGEKSGVVFDSELGGLKLTGATNWDDYPGNVDDWPQIDGLGGIASSGTYEFSEGVDLGAVYPCRVTAAISAISYDPGDTIDQRLSNIDAWPSFDGMGLSDFSFVDTPLNVDIIPNYVVGPNSEMATFLREQDTTPDPALHGFEVPPTEPCFGRSVTAELFVRSEGRGISLGISIGVAFPRIEVNLDTQAITLPSEPAAVIDDYGVEAVGGGFYRIWITAHSIYDFATWDYNVVNLIDNATGDRIYLGDSVSGADVCGYRSYIGPLKGLASVDSSAALFIRTTNDDPEVDPTWSDWRQFFIGEYAARAFEFRAELTGDGGTNNILVNGLSVTVDMPDRIEKEQDLVSGAGTYSATFPSAFKAKPSIVITAKNMATGDYYTRSNESATGFDVVFRDSGDTAVSRTFDYHAKGYGKQIT